MIDARALSPDRRRMRTFLLALSGAVAAVLLVTCAPALVDGLRDGGASRDSVVLEVLGPPDAAAEVLPAACDVELRNWTEYGDGRYTRQTQWYAEVDAPGIDPSRVEFITVVLCDYERFGSAALPPAPSPCPAGATCDIDPPRTYDADCRVSGFAEFVDGRLRVSCGNRYEGVVTVGAAPIDVGERAGSVRFVVR